MFGNIGPWELILILLIALIVVGPGKLPDVARSLGKGLNEFKKATSGMRKEFEDAVKMDDLTKTVKKSTLVEEEILVPRNMEDNSDNSAAVQHMESVTEHSTTEALGKNTGDNPAN
jgi:sec-independent protein translocase protein TatA